MQDLFFGNALGDASAHTKPAYLHASLSSLSRMKLTDMVSIRNVSTSSGTDLKELHVIMWLRGPPLRMHRWAVGGGRTISSVLAELHGVHEERHRVDLGERCFHILARGSSRTKGNLQACSFRSQDCAKAVLRSVLGCPCLLVETEELCPDAN